MGLSGIVYWDDVYVRPEPTAVWFPRGMSLEQLNVQNTGLYGVLLIEPSSRFEDFRGEHVRI